MAKGARLPQVMREKRTPATANDRYFVLDDRAAARHHESMFEAIFLAVAVASGTAPAVTFRIDATRYFADADLEISQRTDLLLRIDALAAAVAQPISAPSSLLSLLQDDDALRRDVLRHEIYVHLKAARDTDDHDAEKADSELGLALDKLDVALSRSLKQLGSSKAEDFLSAEPALGRYRHLVEDRVHRSVVSDADQKAVRLLAQPAIDSLESAYGDLRRAALQQSTTSTKPRTPEELFHARWAPFVDNEASFAALLVPIHTLKEGVAKLEGFANASDAAYARKGLSTAQVHRVLRAVRRSNARSQYSAIVAAEAARKLKVDVDSIRP